MQNLFFLNDNSGMLSVYVPSTQADYLYKKITSAGFDATLVSDVCDSELFSSGETIPTSIIELAAHTNKLSLRDALRRIKD